MSAGVVYLWYAAKVLKTTPERLREKCQLAGVSCRRRNYHSGHDGQESVNIDAARAAMAYQPTCKEDECDTGEPTRHDRARVIKLQFRDRKPGNQEDNPLFENLVKAYECWLEHNDTWQ